MPTQGQVFAPAADRSINWQRGAILVVIAAVLLLCLVLRPATIGYAIRGGHLLVSAASTGATPASYDRTVALDRIEEAGLACLSGGTLAEGTSEAGFCAGYFDYPGLGKVWQATRCQPDIVLLRARGEDVPLVLGPIERADFVEAVRSRTPGTFASAGKEPFPSWRTRFLTLAMVVLPLLFVALVASTRLRYRIDGHTLEVRTLLRRVRIPLRGARATRYRPGRVRRVFGARFPAYATGRFLLDGTAARVYASSRDGVLIDNGERLFVSPEDGDGFLAALAAVGVTVTP